MVKFLQQYWSQLWRYLVAGLLVWIPLIITVWVSWWVVSRLIFGVENLIAQGVYGLNTIGQRFPALSFLQHINYHLGLGFLLVLLLFLSTGFLTRYIVGRKIINFGERILNTIPLIRRIYRAVQQIRDTFIGRNGAVFQHVCMIEYPKEGLYAVAFVTSVEQGDVQRALAKNLLAVFVPTTPNPTSGYLVYVHPNEVTMLDMSVEDAMKLIISGGAYIPSSPRHRSRGAAAAAPDAGAVGPSPSAE